MDGCKVKEVLKGSIAEELEVVSGDVVLEINGCKVRDVLDYKFLTDDSFLEVEIFNQNEGLITLEIEKEPEEDLGMVFDSYLMDEPKPCKNKCIFCFIDQLPKKMRKTLYFKDDDFRLSYLTGNYVTLTNTDEWDIKRIINYRLTPINISIHATDSELRRKMLRTKGTDNLMKFITELNENNIEMNGQIVLCKGYNDKEQLDKTITDLSEFIPNMKSVSIVPVGITRHRENLVHIEAFSKEDCELIINQVGKQQQLFKEKYKTSFVFLSDEIYLKAEAKLPKYNDYEEFPQLENGVGMISLFEDEFSKYLSKLDGDEDVRNISIATGELAKDFIQSLCSKITKKFVNTKINVFAIKNDFFGDLITVSGLVTATDIINQLKDKKITNTLLIPKNMLRKDTDTFLDNLTIEYVKKALNLQMEAVETNGSSFIQSILNAKETHRKEIN